MSIEDIIIVNKLIPHLYNHSLYKVLIPLQLSYSIRYICIISHAYLINDIYIKMSIQGTGQSSILVDM